MLKGHRTLGENGSKYINNYKLTLIQLHCYNCKNNTLIIIYYVFETYNGSRVETITMHLKESKVQLLAPNLLRLIVNSVKLLDGMTIVTYPLDLHGLEMKMNPNLNVSSQVKNVIFNSYICISMTLFI